MFQSFRVDVNSITGIDKGRCSSFDIEELESLLVSESPIDTDTVSNIIFPNGTPDVFLSHSHADINKAARLAREMENLGLKVFIDSEVWGSVFELLKKIDRKFCYQQDSKTFVYDKRNITTSNTFMILNSALIKMIDKAEVFMFVGSSNSLLFDSTEELLGKTKTYSPWIHSELLFSSMVRVKIPERFKLTVAIDEALVKSEASLESAQPKFIHPANTEHLKELSSTDLNSWINCGKKRDAALNKLYQLTGINTTFKVQ